MVISGCWYTVHRFAFDTANEQNTQMHYEVSIHTQFNLLRMLIFWLPVSISSTGHHQAIVQERDCINVKLKFTLEQATKAHRRRNSIAILLI
jgi:hypothetical protein